LDVRRSGAPPQDSDGSPRGERRRPEPTPARRALGLLVRREHSRQELVRKLCARGVDEAEAQAAVQRMAGEGWQDDVRFALSLARSRALNGYGPVRIRAELGMHGIAEDTVAKALSALAEAGEDNWLAMAMDLVHRRYGHHPKGLAARRKAADLLARRGFDGDTVRRASRLGDDTD
jgi:regulatory protein